MQTSDDTTMAREAIREVIENQLRDNAPSETRQTLERLIAARYTREEAMSLLGCAMGAEICEILKHRQPFDAARYVRYLAMLPELPGESE